MAVRKTLFDEVGPFVEIPRGFDVILVRRCVDRHSCESVRYCRAVKVRHMEIDSAWKHFEKVFIYGDSLQTYSGIANARPITNRERFLIFRKTVQKQNYSWIRSVGLFSLLFVGFVYWISGSMSGARKHKQRARL